MKFYREKVYGLMGEKKISKNKLATLIGLSQTAVSSWVKGTKVPRERNVLLIAKALNVPVNTISDMKKVEDNSIEVSGYFQGWGSSLHKNKIELDNPCIKAMKEIEGINQEQYRLRTVVKAFMSTMQSMLYVKNYQGEYIVANESYLKAVGLDIDRSIIGKNDFDILSQKNASNNNIQDMSIMNTGRALINKVVKLPFLEKRIKRCIMTKVPLKDSNLNIVGVVASFTDVTREYELHKKEVMLREAINRAKTAIGINSFNNLHNRKLIYMNDAMSKIFGYSEKEFEKDMLCWRENIIDEDIEKIDNFFKTASIEEKRISFKYKDRMTGKIKHLFFRSSGIEGSNLRYCSCFDETEKVKKDQERENLLIGFKLLAGFIDKTNSAVFVGEYKEKTMDLIEYVYRNRKSYEFFGNDIKWGDCIVPEQRDEALKLSDINKYPKTMRFNVIKRNGTLCSIEERTWLQKENEKTYFLSVFRDIEKQDKVEIQFHDDLEL
jgi:PAS domain-containing protein